VSSDLFRKQLWLSFAVLLIMVGTSTKAGSEGLLSDKSDQPMDIKSMKLTAKKIPTGQELVFEGKVNVKQDKAVLTCDRFIVLYDQKTRNGSDDTERKSKNPLKDQKDSGTLKSAIAYGNVKVVQNDLMAMAGKAVFDNIKKTITLSEGPRLSRGDDWIVANTIIIYVNDNRIELVGGEEKNGVKATINTNPSKLEKEK
jgi:lipopolysaccharide export system protein LptA